MQIDDVETALKGRLEAGWLALYPAITPFYVNMPRPSFDEMKEQLLVDIVYGRQTVIAFGDGTINRYRQSGEMIMRILVGAGTGDTRIKTLGKALAGVMLGFKSGDLQVTSSAPAGGASAAEDGIWYEFDVLVPFYFDTEG